MKAVLPSKAKQGILSLLSKGQQVFSLPQEISDVLCALHGSKDQHCNPGHSHLPLSFPQFLLLSMVYGIFLWSVEVCCPGCVTSTSCALPACSLWCRVTNRDVLTLCKHCSGITKAPLFYQQFFGHKSKTLQHTNSYKEN